MNEPERLPPALSLDTTLDERSTTGLRGARHGGDLSQTDSANLGRTRDGGSSPDTSSDLRDRSLDHQRDQHGHSKDHQGLVKRMTTGLFTPEKKIRSSPSFVQSFINMAKSSWVNVLLVFIPVS
jgi:Ca2+:H+ antiporter